MFTLDDDFDLDEDFLSNAFENTAGKTNTNDVLGGRPNNGAQICNKPLQDLRDLESSRADDSKRQKHVEKKNVEFLELWKSNENNLYNVVNVPKKLDPRSKIDVSHAIGPKGYKTEVFTRITKNVRSRKFPGPAGLLPERNSSTSFIVPDEYISSLEKDSETYSEYPEEEIFSQTTNNLFEEPDGPWQRMIYDLGQLGKQLISTINLSTLQGKQARSGFKVPFLAVFVQAIDCSLPDPSVLLKDDTEEINGTLHREVWEDWKEEILIGSVLVLRNVGVISSGNSSRRYFLNITANNIVTIYSPTQESSIKMIKINSSLSMDTSLILDEWEKLQKQNRQPPPPAADSEPLGRPLFNVFSPGTSALNSSVPFKSPLVRSQFANPVCSQTRGRFSGGAPGIRHSNGYRHNQSPVSTRPPNQHRLQFRPSTPILPRNQNHNLMHSSPALKRPRTVEPAPSQLQMKPPENVSRSPEGPSSIFNISDSDSIMESVLDGIDTDSLFEDF